MIHPIFMTVLRRPELLVRHLANYSTLVKSEALALGRSLAVRAVSALIALAALLLALGLTAVAVMLGVLDGAFHWVLVVVPGTAWLIFLGGVMRAAKSSEASEKVDAVKSEVNVDLGMLRRVQEIKNDE